jgi:hypothetical protein
LVRGTDGKLRCPLDAPGRNELELAQESAMNVMQAAANKDREPADGARPLLGADGQPSLNDYTAGSTGCARIASMSVSIACRRPSSSGEMQT